MNIIKKGLNIIIGLSLLGFIGWQVSVSMMNGNLSTAVEAIEYIPKEIRPVLFMVLTAIIYEIIVGIFNFGD